MVLHRKVIAAAVVFLASMTSLGCRSQPSWSPLAGPGCRVPPPGTGTYGTPNTYYQPGNQSIPATVTPPGARVLNLPSSQWTSVPADEPQVAARSTVTASSSSISAPRLNGMPVNSVRPAEPQAFTPPDMMTELSSTISGSSPSASGVVQASATQSSASSKSSVGSAVWQSRSNLAAPSSATR